VQNQSKSKRYIFGADAIGVSGQITHLLLNDIIPVQAAMALPSDGGLGRVGVDGFRHKDILSFSSAYSEVAGKEKGEGVYETLSTSVVENFNLLDTVTCDRISARLEGTYPCGQGDDSDHAPELCVVPLGSRFEGLRIGDRFFKVLEIAPYFCRPDRACWTGLEKALADEDERRMLDPLSLPDADGTPVPLPGRAQKTDLLGFGIALSDPTPDAKLGFPLRFDLPDFGIVHLGEFFCSPDSRSLTMLRVQLKGKHHGCATGIHTMIRGTPYP
jgi:hypothetical protein